MAAFIPALNLGLAPGRLEPPLKRGLASDLFFGLVYFLKVTSSLFILVFSSIVLFIVASSRLTCEESSAIFLLFARISAVFFSDSY
jgi:hypothetical protein